jgi:hypothetical protein
MIFSGLAGIGASLMSVFLVALFHETRRVRIGLWACLRRAFAGSQRQSRTSGLFELAVLPPKTVGNLVVMRSRMEVGSDASRRVSGMSL